MDKSVRSEEPAISNAGAKVRAQLIDAAGEVFAEKGFEGATSREICLRAGVNLAAVNYHFGGFEALYITTLKEAHRRANWVELTDAERVPDQAPKEKLRAVLRGLVGGLSQSMAKSWEMRLVSRELVIPTFAQAEFVTTSIEPRRKYLKSIIGEIIQRPIDDPLVARCLLTVIAPCITLSIVSRTTLETLLPDLKSGGDAIAALVDHVERFALAGLEAVAKDVSSTDASVKPK